VEIHRDSPTPEIQSPLWLKQRVLLTLGMVLVNILHGSQPEGRGSTPVMVSEPDFVYIFQAKGARGKGVV
jgi:hypothetical protein